MRMLLLAVWSLILLGLTLAIELEQSGEKSAKPLAIFSLIGGFFPRYLNNKLSIRSPRFHLIILISLALIVRLIPLWVMPVSNSNFDIESFRLVGEKANQGIDIYTDPDTSRRHPYLPLQVYWIQFSSWLSERIPFSFDKIVRIEPILADLLITAVIFRMLINQSDKRLAFNASLFFALNPVSWMVSVLQGQFDASPILFLLLCLWVAASNPGLSGVFMGLGILIKSWPVLGLPSIVFFFTQFRLKVKFLVGVIMVPVMGVLLYSAIFHSSMLIILSKAISYNHGVGVWGYTYLLRLMGLINPTVNQSVNFVLANSRFITLLGLAIIWVVVCRRQGLINSTLTIFIAFFAFTHAFAIQYLSWLLPFGLIAMEYKWIKWYTLASFSYMFLVYNTLIMKGAITNLLPWPEADLLLIIPASMPIWIITIAWIIQRYKNVTRLVA